MVVLFPGNRVGLCENIRSDLHFGCEVTGDVLQTFSHFGLEIEGRVWKGKPSASTW